MALTSNQKNLLNKFSDTQIALRDKDAKYADSSMPLGDLVAEALAGPKLASFEYDFSVFGGTIGTKVLGKLKAGWKLTGRSWTDATTVLASGGSATVALEAGVTVLVAAAAFDDAALVGFDAKTAFTPLKLSADTNFEWVIAVAALTAGKAKVYVEYFE